jgi:hypothetical protein
MLSARIIGIKKFEDEQAKWHRLILLGVLVSPISLAVALPAIVRVIREYIDPQFYIICPFLTATGVSCPFCGLTRSLLSFLQGALLETFWYHPIGPVIWGGTALFVLASVVLLVFRRSVELRIPGDLRAASVVASVLLVWIVNTLLGHHREYLLGCVILPVSE